MLSINCPKPKVVLASLENKELEGFSFEIVKTQGLSIIVRVTSGDEAAAKTFLKGYLKTIPELKYCVANVMQLDDNGQVI